MTGRPPREANSPSTPSAPAIMPTLPRAYVSVVLPYGPPASCFSFSPEQRSVPASSVRSLSPSWPWFCDSTTPSFLYWHTFGIEVSRGSPSSRTSQDGSRDVVAPSVVARRSAGRPNPGARCIHQTQKPWQAAHRRLDAARLQYERDTHGERRPRRDRELKYLLAGFGRCALCNGGLHVRTRSQGRRRAFFYACTSHYNRGPEVCPHVDLWPMDAIDRKVLSEMAGQVLAPALADEIVSAARDLYEASAQPETGDQLRDELATVRVSRVD